MHSRSNQMLFSTIFKAGCPLHSAEWGTFGRKEPRTKLLGFSTKEKKITSLIYAGNILGKGNSEVFIFSYMLLLRLLFRDVHYVAINDYLEWAEVCWVLNVPCRSCKVTPQQLAGIDELWFLTSWVKILKVIGMCEIKSAKAYRLIESQQKQQQNDLLQVWCFDNN